MELAVFPAAESLGDGIDVAGLESRNGGIHLLDLEIAAFERDRPEEALLRVGGSESDSRTSFSHRVNGGCLTHSLISLSNLSFGT